MEKYYKKLVIAVVAGVLLFGGWAKASSFTISDVFWKELARIVGPSVADQLGMGSNSPDVSFLGAGNDTYNNRKIAQVIIATTTETGVDTASSTLDQGNLFNPTLANGGSIRRVIRAELFMASTSATVAGGTLIFDFSTSTSQFTSSSFPIYSVTLTTSTNPLSISTTTPNGVVNSGVWYYVWKPGEYFHCSTNRAVSTTNAYCLVEYVNAQ